MKFFVSFPDKDAHKPSPAFGDISAAIRFARAQNVTEFAIFHNNICQMEWHHRSGDRWYANQPANMREAA